MLSKSKERSGSGLECLSRDEGVAGLSWHHCVVSLYGAHKSVLSTVYPSPDITKFCFDWDVKNQSKQTI